MKKLSLFLAATTCAAAGAFANEPAVSLEPHRRHEGGTLSIYYENDLFAGTDRYYTNGTKISYTTPNLNRFEDDVFSRPFAPAIGFLPYVNRPNYQRNFAISIGQNMYTPDNTESATLIESDRPYAGWLYLGFGMIWKNQFVRNALTLEVGMVGPASYAEEAQRLIHDMRGIDVPKGWDNQLRNEIGAMLGYERTWRWPYIENRAGFNYEVLPFAGATLGNVMTYASAGVELRYGFNLPDDFGTPTLAPTSTTNTPVEGNLEADRTRYDFGIYAFFRAEARAVARNIFLDGNTFQDSHSVDKRWFVSNLSAGISMNYHNTKITYAGVYRTEEFHGQVKPQIFGSITLSWQF